MKVRHGFVTNSSSSSFIVMFDVIPKSAEELREKMFGEIEFLGLSYTESFPTQDIAEIVFAEMQRQIEHGKESIEPDAWCFSADEWEEVQKELKDGNVFYFYYCDEFGGINQVMEHGEIFRNFLHERIDHH